MPHSPCHQSHSLPCWSYVSLGCIPDYAAQSFSYSSSTPLFSILLHSRSKQVAYILLFYLKPTHQGLHQVVLSGKELPCQGRRCKKHRFNPCVGMIPWRRVWQPTLIFLPGKSHGQRSLAGYRSWGHKESDTTEHKAHRCIKPLA